MLLRGAGRRSFLRGLCSADSRKGSLGAYGGKGSRGSGKSLMGSKLRGTGALTEAERAAHEAGEFETDDLLEAGDVLMEVLAEDHRYARGVDAQGSTGRLWAEHLRRHNEHRL